ncbi:uncharacterized protein B0H18DRAFT_1123943 [Fomitopsis serialis]|uniref:uncharacterized protein n=1 Tax=Fomitopsis serialis TaxID=139415 RepID=UPI002008E338|nr:uncharacterized protein B0H18DRAFT_1123943 [Neoantrodia serialis]KAH9916873.1 hypothetical protein B0H18DRAFT_1123943 [Neoantrodia serialis]
MLRQSCYPHSPYLYLYLRMVFAIRVQSLVFAVALASSATANWLPLRRTPALSTRDAPNNLAPGSFTNCTSYTTVVSGDTCSMLEAAANISFSDLLRWNPELNTGCTNLAAQEAYCVGGGGDACSSLYTVVSGDTCFSVETTEGLTAAQLLALNPWLDSSCDLETGEVLCVGAAPTSTVASGTSSVTLTSTFTVTASSSAIASPSSSSAVASSSAIVSPSSSSAIAPPSSSSAIAPPSSSSAIAPPSSSSATASPMPTNIAGGSWTNCTTYYTVQTGDSCTSIDTSYKIAFSDFLRWNPEVSSNCDDLEVNEAYCVKGSPACSKVYTVASGDYCAEIESDYGLTAAQLYALNPWLDSACDLEVGENLCVG